MLAIRMQRVGRSGHAQFRMIVQDSRFHPTSGRVVAYLGNYDPHSKQSNFNKDKLMSYLTNGAQPSPRVIKLLKSQKITLPDWVSEPAPKKKAVRNPDKRRSTRPEGASEPEAKAPADKSAEAPAESEAPAEKTEEVTEETTTEPETPAMETQPAETSEEPAKEPKKSTE